MVKRLLLHMALATITLVVIYPILVVIGISLRPQGALYSTSLSIIPDGATLDAYRVVLLERPFGLWMRNSAHPSGAL